MQLSLFPDEEPEEVASEDCRQCKACKQELPSSDFWILANRKSGSTSLHSVCIPCMKKGNKVCNDWRNANPLPDDYSCPICSMSHQDFTNTGRYLTKTPFCVDHCHTTMKVRGYICNRCNAALGLACDDKEVLQKMINYLDA